MKPIQPAERFVAIDVLRGVALLGILVMNIQGFAMPMAAYFNPTALGPPSTVDFAIWTFSHLLFDQKFMTIFSLLFGAGIVIMTSRAEADGRRSALLHYRRMLALFVFGMLHAYLIWDGDILVLYAICGAIVFPFRRLRPRALVAMAVASFVIGSSIMVAAGSYLPSTPIEVRMEFTEFYAPGPEALQRETAAMRGSWRDQMAIRVPNSVEFQLEDIPLWGLWRAAGLMLAGMSLFKLRIVTGERSDRFYERLALGGFALGLPVIALGVIAMRNHRWEPLFSFFIAGQYNYWASMVVAGGWIGLIMLVWKRAPRPALAPLAAVGRMAFSCYILTSLICTFIFYGHGLGWFGYVSRPGQLAVTVAVWITLLIAAPLWLRRFRFGPLEWIWRTLTYAARQPFVREPGAGGINPSAAPLA